MPYSVADKQRRYSRNVPTRKAMVRSGLQALYKTSELVYIYRRIVMKKNVQRAIKAAFQATSVLRSRDLEQEGFNRPMLKHMLQQGQLHRLDRGLYTVPDAEVGENHTLAEVATHTPHAVVCLLSALRFHGLTTQNPHETWIAIDGKAHQPKSTHLPMKIARFSGTALSEGQGTHKIEGVNVRIYNPAKTVADCFKYRNKIGLDIAIEALRDCVHSKRCTPNELMQYAHICRVDKIMRPYLEAMI
jgi:predicted transcriptional regulator of viral defense system